MSVGRPGHCQSPVLAVENVDVRQRILFDVPPDGVHFIYILNFFNLFGIADIQSEFFDNNPCGVITTDSFFRLKHLVFSRPHWHVSDVICIVTHTSALKTNDVTA